VYLRHLYWILYFDDNTVINIMESNIFLL